MAALAAMGGQSLIAATPAASDTGEWAVLPTPSPGTGDNELLSVSGSAEDDFWAVGRYETSPGGPVKPLSLHWHGSGWHTLPVPVPAGKDRVELTGVMSIAHGDAWAVGHAGTMAGDDETALILRWRTGGWQTVPSPAVGDPDTPHRLKAVAASGTNDVWAIGEARRLGRTRPVVLHWDGTAWTVVPVPEPSAGDTVLSAVAVRSATEAWAVGHTSSAVAGPAVEPYVLRWNGSTWSRVPTPNDGDIGLTLSAVAVGQAGTVMATGEKRWRAADGSITRRSAVLRYSGTAWQIVPVPASYVSADASINSVAISRKGEIWVVGHNPRGESFAQFHPSDNTWQLLQGANSGPNYGHTYIWIVDRVWCVGYQQVGEVRRTYSEWSPMLG
ncbi:hypothetical protein E1292_24385 [Nonomuraea deserti]|uniref:Exo-alpha-sialidase n=1 Tax=Nonomuraea deserti TaxID=1848322 RepID=A0A4R4VBA3_9ACTN|nr:hypothetical protein [Nonomuraea deserti]TDD02051.1 hypothetical protein E1292_24385 [Nonomuraea deserti]